MRVCPRCRTGFAPYRVWTYYDPVQRMFTRERRFIWSEVCNDCRWDGLQMLEEDNGEYSQ